MGNSRMCTRASDRSFFAVVLTAAAVLALGQARPASAGLIPGGGKAASDCYAEFDVQGVSGSNKVTCTDGEPGCDSDSACQGTCTFRVAVCLNQTNVPGCNPKPFTELAKGELLPLASGWPSGPHSDLACGEFAVQAKKARWSQAQHERPVKRHHYRAVHRGT